MYYHRKPDVKISESIYNTRSDHLVRTSTCHEFGHVWIHAPLWCEAGAKIQIATAGPVWNCHRENVLNPPEYDWTEWQADGSAWPSSCRRARSVVGWSN